MVSPTLPHNVLIVHDQTDGTDWGGHLCCRTEERIMAHFGQPGSRQSIEYKDAEPDVFNKWFPGLKLSSTACTNARQGSFCIYH